MPVTWSIDFGTGKILSSDGEHIATMRPTCVNGEWEYDARLIAKAPETDRLCMQLATVANNPAVADYLPFGLLDEVKAWLSK